MSKKANSEGKVIKADFKAKKVEIHTESEGKTVIRPKVTKNVAPPLPDSISVGQKAELKSKVEEWVNASRIMGKPVTYGGANTRLFRQSKSRGVKGSPDLANFAAVDFEKGMKYLNTEIGKVKRSKKFRDNDPEAWVKSRIIAIKTRLRQNKISREKEHEYLLAKFGEDSVTKLEAGDLQVFYDYVMANGKFLIPKPKEKSIQELRETELQRLVEASNLSDSGTLPMWKEDVWGWLVAHSPGLFGEMGGDTFNTFWKRQKLYRCRTGRKPSSKETP